MTIALYGNPSQSYGASPAIWDHTILCDCDPIQPVLQRLLPQRYGYRRTNRRTDGRTTYGGNTTFGTTCVACIVKQQRVLVPSLYRHSLDRKCVNVSSAAAAARSSNDKPSALHYITTQPCVHPSAPISYHAAHSSKAADFSTDGRNGRRTLMITVSCISRRRTDCVWVKYERSILWKVELSATTKLCRWPIRYMFLHPYPAVLYWWLMITVQWAAMSRSVHSWAPSSAVPNGSRSAWVVSVVPWVWHLGWQNSYGGHRRRL